jgi:hypothetical protein
LVAECSERRLRKYSEGRVRGRSDKQHLVAVMGRREKGEVNGRLEVEGVVL